MLEQPWQVKETEVNEVNFPTMTVWFRPFHSTIRGFFRVSNAPRFAYNPGMPHGIAWADDEERLLGTLSDQDLAQRLGRSLRAIILRRHQLHIPKFHSRRRPWTQAEEELLGTMPDRRFARKFKRSVRSVIVRRCEKGIPLLRRLKRRWTPADDKLLGARPDAQVALLLGISRLAVSRRRQRLGISARR